MAHNLKRQNNHERKTFLLHCLYMNDNEYYHTVVIATEKLSNSEAKPRCYDNIGGDNNRVVIFLNQHCDHFNTVLLVFHFYFLWISTFSKVSDISFGSVLRYVLICPPPSPTHTHRHKQTQTHIHLHTLKHSHARTHTHTHTLKHSHRHTHTNLHTHTHTKHSPHTTRTTHTHTRTNIHTPHTNRAYHPHHTHT